MGMTAIATKNSIEWADLLKDAFKMYAHGGRAAVVNADMLSAPDELQKHVSEDMTLEEFDSAVEKLAKFECIVKPDTDPYFYRMTCLKGFKKHYRIERWLP